MVIKGKCVTGTKLVSRSSAWPDSNKELIVCCTPASAPGRARPRAHPATATASREAEVEAAAEAEDVIDLGAPRRVRRAPCERVARPGRCPRPRPRAPYTPNPRLYPGPTRQKPKVKGEPGRSRRARRRRVFQRPVPNARLYRPLPAPAPPPRPPPPPAWPRARWPPPAGPAPRALDTASRAALRLVERRPPPAPSPPPPSPPPARPPALSRHLVVSLPAAAGGDAPRPRARPGSALSPSTSPSSRGRRRRFVMDASNRHSASPEDCSDGNDTLSAPSEFLAEFLSAIMRRQYAEALKYCRLILQYEPHNATARGFYPLLEHKVQAHEQQEGLEAGGGAAAAGRRPRWAHRGSSSEEASPHAHSQPHAYAHAHEVMAAGAAAAEEMQQGADSDSERSDCGSQSSLELDSDAPPAHSLDLSRRTDPTDSASGSSGASSRTSGVSGGCWESSGSASRSEADADADDNGNALASGTAAAATHTAPDAGAADAEVDADEGDADVENDNASARASLRRLRAQFACSIK